MAVAWVSHFEVEGFGYIDSHLPSCKSTHLLIGWNKIKKNKQLTSISWYRWENFVLYV